MFYLICTLASDGSVKDTASIEMVKGRAAATEFVHTDAEVLKKKAEKKWPAFEWQIDKTYSGKYVVRGQEVT